MMTSPKRTKSMNFQGFFSLMFFQPTIGVHEISRLVLVSINNINNIEASCFLCNEDMRATSHILGACNVALSPARFTFRHDNVVRIIICNVRSSVKNIKSSVPISKQPIKIKFLKKGTRARNKNSSSSGILHQASDWVL